MQIKNLPACERPRERLAKYGPDKLRDDELLAILLRSGTKSLNVVELSKKILKNFPKEKLLAATVEDLKKTHGLGTAKACEIIACIELGKRLLKDKQAALFLKPEDVWHELSDLREKKKEHFVVFYLDVRNQEVKREVISIGTLSASLIHPREVFEPAIRHIAAQVMLAHNHPSGSSDPSDEDVFTTSRLVEAGKLLGIEVLDHVIVVKEGWTSMRERGYI